MELNISKAQGEVKNVNLRTENNGDERVLATDIKIVANVSVKEITPLFSDTPQMLATLFDKGGNVLNPVVEFKYRVPIENIELTIDKLKPFKGGRVKKNMKMVPRNGNRFEVTMTLQLTDVGDIRELANRLHEEVAVSIIERQQSLGLQSAA
jgi:hypothetical protein